MARDILMGIDGGTGSIRVGLFDFEGHEITFDAVEYDTAHPYPGWAEQKPEDWWSALREAIHNAMDKAGVTSERILAMALDTTSCTVVAAKKDGTPLRDCILWMDVRAAQEAKIVDDAVKKSKENVYFGPTIAEAMPCKLLWLKRNQREIYDSAEVFCEYQDWMMHRLIGKWTMNTDQASARWYYNATKREFPKDLFEMAGIGDAIDRFPKESHMPGDHAGCLCEWAAKDLGLDTQVQVIHGGIDAYLGIIGMGIYDNTKVSLITGSSHILMAFADHPYKSDFYGAPKMDGFLPGYGIIDAGQTSTGSIIAWFKQNFAGDLEKKAKETGKSVYYWLDQEAKAVAPGSEGLLVLDWWQGNRAPYADTDIRGMIYGLSLNHTRGHVFRAIMEGIAYGTQNNFNCLRRDGFKIDEVIVSGGVTNSPVYTQIHADVANVVMKIPEQIQTPTLGCAILAAVGAGVYSDLKTACETMVRYKDTIKPIAENVEIYKKIFKQYEAAYPLMKDWMHNVTALK